MKIADEYIVYYNSLLVNGKLPIIVLFRLLFTFENVRLRQRL